ncbi:MAG: hypothetical protein GF350_17125 [Chitinivibrionales bacterium]|nr:hypothetical protein [Chitinivibrionales bacterium]
MLAGKSCRAILCIFALLSLIAGIRANTGIRTDAIELDEVVGPQGWDTQTYRGDSRPMCFHHCATIQETSPGKFVCVWYVTDGCEEEDVMVAVSYNHGSDWSEPAILLRWDKSYNPGLFQPKRDPDQPLYLYTRNTITASGHVLTSPDEGIHWQQPPDGALFETKEDANAPAQGTWLPDAGNALCVDRFSGLIKNPGLELPDGSIYLGSSTECPPPLGATWKSHIEWAPYKNYDGTNGSAGGWQYISIDAGNDMIQPSFLVLSGDYQHLMATGRPKTSDIATSVSTDGGATWSRGSSIQNRGRKGHCSLTMDNGYHVLMAEDNSRNFVYVSISSDAQSWQDVIHLNEPDGGAYPVVIQASDRKLHVVFTQFRKSAESCIRHVVLDPEKLIGKSPTEGPSISAQPQNATADNGSTATFSVSASGDGELYYQWQRNTGGGLWYNLGRESSYTTETVKDEMDGWKYRCVVSDNTGSTVSDEVVLNGGAVVLSKKGFMQGMRGDFKIVQHDNGTDVTFSLETGGIFSVKLLDINGRLVASLCPQRYGPGTYQMNVTSRTPVPGSRTLLAVVQMGDERVVRRIFSQ